MKRRFVSNHYNGFSVRNHYFIPNPSGRGCFFETDDPDVIRLIESIGDYGSHVFPAETPEEIAAMKAKGAPKLKGPSKEQLGEELNEMAEPKAPLPDYFDLSEPPPIAHQGARGTSAGKDLRKGDLTVKGERK